LFLPGFFLIKSFNFTFENISALISLSICVSLTLLVCCAFISSYFGLPKETPAAVSAIICFFTGSLFLFKKKKGKFEVVNDDVKTLCIIAFFTLFSLVTQLVLPSHDSIWSVYYERQVNAVYSANKIPVTDDLSYLGRAFTFVPGYMLLRSAYSWAAQTAPVNNFFIFQILGNIFFVSSVLFLCKKLNINFKESFIFLMFLFSSSFIFGWAIISLLHLFGFSFFIISLALALDKKSFSSLFAGIASIFHASFLIAFPVMFLIFSDVSKKTIRNVIAYSLIALFIFLVLYSPTILQYGWPNEIQSKNWGYLITGDIIDLGTNTAGIMSLAIIPAIVLGLKRQKKLALLTIVFIAAFFILSYRVNVFLTLTAALLFVKVFDSKQFIALSLLFFSSFLLNCWLYQGVIGAEIKDPFIYIDSHTAFDAKLLVEPLYGHTSNYFSNRKSLADLYVEYASDEKYNDAVNFIATGNQTILKKWNISYVVTNKRNRAIAVNKYIEPNAEIIYPALDKIYDNGVFNIHYYNTLYYG